MRPGEVDSDAKGRYAEDYDTARMSVGVLLGRTGEIWVHAPLGLWFVPFRPKNGRFRLLAMRCGGSFSEWRIDLRVAWIDDRTIIVYCQS